jgi:hypothetical protein
MDRLASAWAVLLTAALWALPCGATVLELHRPLAPPPAIPDRPAFEELLFSFADPDRALEGGFTTPSLSLAVRSRSWGFISTGNREQRDALGSLSESLKDLTMAELPAGRSLVSLLALGDDGGQVRLRDLGPRLSGPQGFIQKGVDSALAFLHVSRPVAAVSASVAALGLLYQFGTKPVNSLGVPLSVSGTLLRGHLNTTVQLNSEPRFQNARTDIAVRVRMPELLTLGTWRLDQIEVGSALARTADGLLLDTRWANLRGRISWLELCLGAHSSQGDPAIWSVLETGVQREHFSVRAVLNHQWATARTRLMATATLRTGQVLSGFFIGGQDTQELAKHTFGLIGTGVF